MTTVLIADDSAIVRKLMRKRIGQTTAGYAVEFLEASDGQEALDILLNQEVHLALIDYNMPHLNGIEVIRQFKAAQSPYHPYLFMVTTEASSDIVMASIKAGAHNYVIKNNLDTGFITKIRSIILPEDGQAPEQG